jgi:FMN-dependent NADH-azoreductase
MTAFDCRVAEREFKAEQKKNAKTNLDAAVDELMDEFEAFDDSVCGDGVWNAQ